MNDNNDKCISFPQILNNDSSNSLDISTTSNQDISVVIDNLVHEEVNRMQKNLYFLDLLEDELKSQVQERMNNGTLDINLLQDIIATMNKSVRRSNDIIKDKNSDLIQVLIDARTQNNTVQVNSSTENNDSMILDNKSRKKLIGVLSALLEVPDDEE